MCKKPKAMELNPFAIEARKDGRLTDFGVVHTVCRIIARTFSLLSLCPRCIGFSVDYKSNPLVLSVLVTFS